MKLVIIDLNYDDTGLKSAIPMVDEYEDHVAESLILNQFIKIGGFGLLLELVKSTIAKWKSPEIKEKWMAWIEKVIDSTQIPSF